MINKKFMIIAIIISIVLLYTAVMIPNITSAQQIQSYRTIAIVRSMIRLNDGRILYVAPVYATVPDYQEWGIVFPNGTIKDYRGHLINNHVINFVTITSNGTVLATAKPETSGFPAGPMAIFKYNEKTNNWVLITEYKGVYHRLDPLTLVTYNNDFIVSGVLQTHADSKWYAFVLRLTPNGKLIWIHVFKDVDAGKGAVKLMRYNNMFFLLLGGTNITSSSRIVRIYRLDPDTGRLSLLLNVPRNVAPFTIKDSTGTAHDTFGLFNKDTGVLSIYNPTLNCYTNYTIPEKIKAVPWEAEYYSGTYYISFIGYDGNIYYMIANQSIGRLYVIKTNINSQWLTGPLNIMHTDGIVVISACSMSSLSSIIFVIHPENPIYNIRPVSNCMVCIPSTTTVTTTLTKSYTYTTTYTKTITKTSTTTYTTTYTKTSISVSVSPTTITKTTTNWTATGATAITLLVIGLIAGYFAKRK